MRMCRLFVFQEEENKSTNYRLKKNCSVNTFHVEAFVLNAILCLKTSNAMVGVALGGQFV